MKSPIKMCWRASFSLFGTPTGQEWRGRSVEEPLEDAALSLLHLSTASHASPVLISSKWAGPGSRAVLDDLRCCAGIVRPRGCLQTVGDPQLMAALTPWRTVIDSQHDCSPVCRTEGLEKAEGRPPGKRLSTALGPGSLSGLSSA